MSLPLRIRIDWDKMRVCEKCAERIVDEVKSRYDDIKAGKLTLNIADLLCDECWKYNTDNGGVIVELDPRLIRKNIP